MESMGPIGGALPRWPNVRGSTRLKGRPSLVRGQAHPEGRTDWPFLEGRLALYNRTR